MCVGYCYCTSIREPAGNAYHCISDTKSGICTYSEPSTTAFVEAIPDSYRPGIISALRQRWALLVPVRKPFEKSWPFCQSDVDSIVIAQRKSQYPQTHTAVDRTALQKCDALEESHLSSHRCANGGELRFPSELC